MAVIDVYANPIVESAEQVHFGPIVGPSRTISVFGGRGEEVMEMLQVYTIPDGTEAGSVIRLFNSVPAKYYVDDVELYNAGGGTGTLELGFYKVQFGPVVNASVLGVNLDLSVTHTYPTPLHCLNNIDSTNDFVKPLWQLCGDVFDKEPNALDLAFTVMTNIVGDTRILVKARFITPVS